jgi:hypothetical protein
MASPANQPEGGGQQRVVDEAGEGFDCVRMRKLLPVVPIRSGFLLWRAVLPR